MPVPNEKQTFGQFVEKWIAAVTPTLRAKTAYNYAQLLRQHAVPIIGRIPLIKLQPADLIRVYEQRLYRLTSDGQTTYTYDPVGNRKSVTTAGSTKTFAYDKADRITTSPYVIDAAGNMTRRERPTDGGQDQLTYDQANRLTMYWNPYVWANYYTYNGDGLPMKIVSGGGVACCWYQLFDINRSLPVVLEQISGSAKYVWGVDLLYVTDYMGQVSSVAHEDALSSVRSLTDSNGNVIQTYQRDAYGRRTSTTGNSGQPFDFTGEFRDQNTGFLFLRTRMYDPQIGRFLTRDAFPGSASKPASLNQFSYVYNNPATLRDPSGRCPFCLLPVAIWLGVELGLFGFDTIDTAQTVFDPSTSEQDKALAIGGYGAGLLLPGGGYGFGLRTAGRVVPVTIGRVGLEHTLSRHVWGGAETGGASVFNLGENIIDLLNMADSVPQVLQQSSGNWVRVVDAGRKIGFDVDSGSWTSFYTVVTNAEGALITMFPGLPRVP